jgi:hypothetical protein
MPTGPYSTGTYGTAVYGAAPTPPTGVSDAAAGPVKDLTVRLRTIDGTWETVGVDRLAGIVVENDSWTADEWGPSKASFDLRRDPGVPWPDLRAFTDIDAEIGGQLLWSGALDDTPTSEAEYTINVQCHGAQFHLDDDTLAGQWVHNRLADWRDSRSFPEQLLTRYVTAPTVTNDRGVITLGWSDGSPARTNDTVGITLDMGASTLVAKRVVFTWANNLTDGNILLYVWGTNTPNALDGTNSNAVTALNVAGAGPGATSTLTTAATLASGGRRYMHFLLLYTGPGGTYTSEQVLRLTDIQVYAETAYESGNASALKASTIVNDALTLGTSLFSSDRSLIQVPSFSLPTFGSVEQRTPREIIQAANAVQDWRAKIDVYRRMIFEPKPASASVEIGAWPGSVFDDASANSGDEIYNRVIVEGAAPNGQQVRVERTAGQQSGVSLDIVSAPAADNPSFATNTTSWTPSAGTAITRDTTVFDTTPASGRWDRGAGVPLAAGDTLTETFTGTFQRGASYTLLLTVRSSNAFGASFGASFGVSGDEASTTVIADTGFLQWALTWTPIANQTAVRLALVADGGSYLHVDSLRLGIARPTLVDRRGFRRTHVLQANMTLTPALGQQIGDVWLAAHKTTPLKGTVRIVGHGACREIMTGAGVAPERLLTMTGDLLRLSHRIDPDTGGVGQDGRIVEVTYARADDTATVALDSRRTSQEALLERLAVVVGSR